MNCKKCDKLLKLTAKTDTCHKCMSICPKCGSKKYIYAVKCKRCVKSEHEKLLNKKTTWYLSEEEKGKQIERIENGLCKFGCGNIAMYPINGKIKDRCLESANSCPEVVKHSTAGLRQHWDSLSLEGRKSRSSLASQKIKNYRKCLSKEETGIQWDKRNNNLEWKKNLSIARKRVIEAGMADNLKGIGYSKICREFCFKFGEYFSMDDIYYEGHGGERVFPGGFKADFLNHTKKFIIEFNGDYWHCNPKTWKQGDYNKAIKMLAKDKWKYDEKRYKIFKTCGYRVYIVWETDWLLDEEECMKNIINEINKESI